MARGRDGNPRDSTDQNLKLVLKLVEGPRVGTTLCPYHDVQDRIDGKQMQSDELAESSFESVSIDSGVSVSRYDDAHTQVRLRGRTHPNQQTVRSESLPLASNSFEVRPAADPSRSRKSMTARRLRTSTAV